MADKNVKPTADVKVDNASLNIGRSGPIGKEQIEYAFKTVKKYLEGKKSLDARLVENEKWWRLQHWDVIGAPKNPEDPTPRSAWLFNSIANKHADAMDNYPEPAVLPRELGDKDDAEVLSNILPVVFDRNKFKKSYSDAWWYKLKHGSAVYGVYWNNTLDNGVGDVDIKYVDILNLFWEPGVKDIQDSENLFTIDSVKKDKLVEMYPYLEGAEGMKLEGRAEYKDEDKPKDNDSITVYDWYYKKLGVTHYVKFALGEVIYASENDSTYAQSGFYAHGYYPFVVDTLFPVETSPCGFGYIDIMKDPQMHIDKFNQFISKNAALASRKRFFVRDGHGVNLEQFADYGKEFVEVEGSLDEEHIREINTSPLPGYIGNYIDRRIDELKETSGNRDFSQGSTASGVTAASAIVALQEAGSKLSRDMIQTSYQAFERISELTVELIRQFYDEERTFRIVGKQGDEEFVAYDNSNIKMQTSTDPVTGDENSRVPIFDIKIMAQKKSPFQKIAQNELAKELYSMGLFDPANSTQALMVLDMMEFEGKDLIVKRITELRDSLQQS